MALRAVKPDSITKRLKLLVYGPPGVGKTMAAIQFPNSYLMDLERGAENYHQSILKSKSVVFNSTDFDDIRQEIKSLLTENHSYKTLIIDPITILYGAVQEKWTRVFEKHATSEKQAEIGDFGMRYWGKVKSDYKSVQRLLLNLDCNIIVTSHQKDIYGPNMQKIGIGADTMRGDEYFFDYVFQLEKIGNKRMAIKIKERTDIGGDKFPDSFEWSYDNFRKFYGSDILEKQSTPVALATEDQVHEIEHLLSVVKIDQAVIDKWLAKAECDIFSEMKKDDIQKCIDYIKDKLKKGV